MAYQTKHNVDTLRRMLESLAERDHEYQIVSPAKAAELEVEFRDCRLELLRLMPSEISDEQLVRLRQMEARPCLVSKYNANPDSIGLDAKQALESFGWLTNT